MPETTEGTTKKPATLDDILQEKAKKESTSDFSFVGLKMEKGQAAQLETLLGLEAGAGGADIFREMLRVVIASKRG